MADEEDKDKNTTKAPDPVTEKENKDYESKNKHWFSKDNTYNIDMNKTYQKADYFTIPDSAFSTPEMGDYYLGAVDEQYFNMLDQIVNDVGPDEARARDAAFYTETPANKDLGYHDNSSFVKAKLDDSAIDNGWVDGKTLRIPISSLEFGSAEAKKKFIDDMNNGDSPYGKSTDKDYIYVNMYGIDTPTPNKYAEESNVSEDDVEYKCVPDSDAKGNPDYVSDEDQFTNSGMHNYVKVGGKWHMVTQLNKDSNNKMSFKWLVNSHSAGEKDKVTNNAFQAQQRVKDLIDKNNGEVYIQLDRQVNNTGDSDWNSITNSDNGFATLQKWAGDQQEGKNNGFCLAKNAIRNNYHGIGYVKADGKWVNLAKAELTGRIDGVTPDENNDNSNNPDFGQNYDEDAEVYADAFIRAVSQLDDRPKIQKSVFSNTKDWEELKKWTVTIGDVTLLIPPTNIQVSSEITEETVPLLRAKGSMHKNGKRDSRTLSMTVYFFGDKGVNGVKVTQVSPSGKSYNYSVDGLRALIAEFKFIPFVPLENDYLNDVLGIQAVTFDSISIQNVPSFGPRLFVVNITMTEFDFSAYIPEVCTECCSTGYEGNWFSTAFNWPVMRNYYQHAILAGDEMASTKTTTTDEKTGKKITVQAGVNDKEYIQKSVAMNKTALQPMAFQSSELKFYIADEQYLNEMLKAKRQRKREILYSMNFNNQEKQAAKDIADVASDARDYMKSDEFKNGLTKIANEGPYESKLQGEIINTPGGDGHLGGMSPSSTTVKTHEAIVKDSDKKETDAFKELFEPVVEKLKQNDKVSNVSYKMEPHRDDANPYILIGVEVTIKSEALCKGSTKANADIIDKAEDYITDDSVTDDVKGKIGDFVGVNKDDIRLKGNVMYLPIKIPLKKDTSTNPPRYMMSDLTPEDDEATDKFIDYCKDKYGDDKSSNPSTPSTEGNGDGKNTWKKATSMAQLDNLKFIPLDAGEFVVNGFSAALVNHQAMIYLQDVAGSTPQYLGGEDTKFNVHIITTNTKTVSTFTTLPKRIGAIMRQYREVIPCCPLKIDSEFTRFFGVNEVSVTNVDVNTVPGQPGVYDITLVFTSMDRTLRNREAMEMLQADNAGKLTEDKKFSIWQAEEAASKLATKKINSYFDIKATISKAELYPDLELPTISEMNAKGWNYLRYKFQDDRVYVDPDFYFVYLNQLSCQMLRELILQSVECGVDGSHEVEDSSGAKTNVKPLKYGGFATNGHNKTMDAQLTAVKNAQSSVYKQNSKELKQNVKDDTAGADPEDYENWEICKDIKAMYLEPRYKKEYDSYVARKRSNEVNSSDEDPETKSKEDGGLGTLDEYTKEEYENLSQEEQEKVKQNTINKKEKENGEKAQKQQASEAAANDSSSTSDPKNSNDDTQNKDNKTGEDKNSDSKKTDTTKTDEEKKKEEDAKKKEQDEATKKRLDEERQTAENTHDSATDADKITEGKWVAKQLENAALASARIESFLKNDWIDDHVKVPDLCTVREKFIAEEAEGSDTKDSYQAMRTEINNAVQSFLQLPEVTQILELLSFDVSPAFINVVKDIVFSAACAATGEKEFSSKKESTNWMPAPDFIGFKLGSGLQDKSNASTVYDVDEAVEEAVEFGVFKIKLYNREEFINVTGEYPEDVWEQGDMPKVNTSNWLIDRRYRYEPEDVIKTYKKGCINSPTYCTYAYMRNMLYWIKWMVDNQVIPSINGDVLRKSAQTELEVENKEEELNVADKEKNKALRDHIQFFSKNVYSLDAGKMWTASCLASSDGSKGIKQRILKRDYSGLNEYSHGCSVPSTAISPDDKASLAVRKMDLALMGAERISENEGDARGVPQDLPAVKHARDYNEKKYCEFAEDPSKYMLHACHDMIVNDARGRMLRAFPTYYILFIDEGREYGTWVLNDNFYNSMNIMEFTIVKDKKNPADTATITLSNIYESNNTEEMDRLRVNEGSFGQLWQRVWDPSGYGAKKEAQRQNTKPPDHITLRAGARIHLRAGYGSCAAMLPILFNGTVAEISATDTVDIVAQGDGLELMNPFTEKEEAHNISNGITIFKNGDTPKNLLISIFNYDGGIIRTLLKWVGRPDLLGTNPFGIYHFGNKNYKDINECGECGQNIFEAWGKPVWGNSDQEICTEDHSAPKISFETFGKTIWDIANICRSTMPDFICSVVPFGFRSTLFMGANRYYYAYDYTNVNGAVQEMRKPFQQYHLYTTSSDIIADGIKASSQKMKTTATGLYEVASLFNIKMQKTVGPLYADIDIYPENQKSMVVDTQLYAKGATVFGACGLNILQTFTAVDNLLTSIENGLGELTGNTSLKSAQSNESIAWRMTASALRASMTEMYCGDLVILGDPSIKPYDRVFIEDTYEGITGQFTAKEVVHHMSVQDGFTTTVSPDCIVTVEDRFEVISHNFLNKTLGVGASGIISLGVLARNAYLLRAGRKEEMITLGKMLKMAKDRVGNKVNKIMNKAGLSAAEKAKYAKKVKKRAKQFKNVIKATKVAKKVTKGAGVIRGAMIGASVGAVLGPIGAIGGAVIGALVSIAIECISTMIAHFIKNFMRNLQVVTVFPLHKWGLCWTAGMEGSKGCIWGSPSYNEQGNLTDLMAHAVSPDNAAGNIAMGLFFDEDTQAMAESLKRGGTATVNPDTTVEDQIAAQQEANMNSRTQQTSAKAGNPNTDTSKVTSGDSDTTRGQKIADSTKQSTASINTETMPGTPKRMLAFSRMLRANLKASNSNESADPVNASSATSTTNTANPSSTDSSNTDSSTNTNTSTSTDDTVNANTMNAFKSLLFGSIGAKTGKNEVAQDYRRMEMMPRADFSRSDDVAKSYKHYAMTDPEKFQNDPKLQYNYLISEDKRLTPYISDGFLKIIHQYPNLDLGYSVSSVRMNLHGDQKYIKIIKYTNSDNTPIYDLPMLNPEAMHILFEIVRRTKNDMPAANSSDPYESYDDTKNSFISLESALRVGDKESYGAAGFTFIIRGVEKVVKPMQSAIQELTDEIKKDYDENKSCNNSLFDAKDIGDNKIAIVVRMPRISSESAMDAPIKSNSSTSSSGNSSSDSNSSSSSDSSNSQ